MEAFRTLKATGRFFLLAIVLLATLTETYAQTSYTKRKLTAYSKQRKLLSSRSSLTGERRRRNILDQTAKYGPRTAMNGLYNFRRNPLAVDDCAKEQSCPSGCSTAYNTAAANFPFSVEYTKTQDVNSTTFVFLVCTSTCYSGDPFCSPLSSLNMRVQDNFLVGGGYKATPSGVIDGCDDPLGPGITWNGAELGDLAALQPAAGVSKCSSFSLAIPVADADLTSLCQQNVVVIGDRNAVLYDQKSAPGSCMYKMQLENGESAYGLLQGQTVHIMSTVVEEPAYVDPATSNAMVTVNEAQQNETVTVYEAQQNETAATTPEEGEPTDPVEEVPPVEELPVEELPVDNNEGGEESTPVPEEWQRDDQPTSGVIEDTTTQDGDQASYSSSIPETSRPVKAYGPTPYGTLKQRPMYRFRDPQPRRHRLFE